jgi:NAD(P)-dependent dehydrogenase (short-subunit alcohol dehydrogenase family)
MELEGKVCLITGASGALGSAVAERFSREGARLAITYYSTRPAELLVNLTSTNGFSVPAYVLDVTRLANVRQVVEAVMSQFGRIDVLVNSTGRYGPIGPTHELSEEEWVAAIQANLIGAFYLVRAVLPIMLEQGSGSIIHFSGGGAAYGRPYFTAYGSAKTALVRFTESVAAETAELNVRVNAIAPGPVKSRMWEQLREAGPAAGERALEELNDMDANGGVGPSPAASLAVFLASERSKGITGRLISAVHDDWDHIDQRIARLQRSDAWMLRRMPLE